MLFPTFTFAAFFLVVYPVHVLLRAHTRAWKLAMVAASGVFYSWWIGGQRVLYDPSAWRFFGLIAASIIVNWGLSHVVGPNRDSLLSRKIPAKATSTKSVLWIAVAFNLGLLSIFKYYGFFSLALLDLLNGDPLHPPIPLHDIVLPVGISFFTFQALSYVIDVHRGKIAPADLLDVAFYISFFPQLVAGPIVRASEFLPQLRPENRPERVPVTDAIWLFGRGVFKKVVISTYLAEAIVDPAFAGPGSASRSELWFAMYGYAIQIYADFSGYTDMAIGLALLMGFVFPQNFDNPYRATSIQDFWRRWHQTLSRWLRDYLYFPLGGNRNGRLLTYRNLMLTMVLGGLWHGAAWRFVVWGAIHGVALAANRLFTQYRNDRATPSDSKDRRTPTIWGPIASWLLTFHVVCVAWVFFRAPSWGEAMLFLRGLVDGPSGGPLPLLVGLIVVASVATQFLPLHLGAAARSQLARLHPLAQGACLGVWFALVVALGPQGVAPFIYFRF